MDAGKKKINDILNGNRKLLVPFFQRSYVWKEDLWERFMESMEMLSTSKKEYFLGSIILKQETTSTSSNVGDVRTIIDGQQRLTTFALFMKVLCHRTGRKKMFERMFELENNEFAIHHSRFDKPIFDKILSQTELTPIHERSRLANAYNFFLEKIEVDKFDIDSILSHISLIGIDLNNEDDEQVIFDTINSIGVKLTTGELLKNYLFNQDNYNLYTEKWEPIFEKDEETLKYWDTSITKGRSIRKNLEVFLRAFLHIQVNDPNYEIDSSQKERYNRGEDLFSQYKDFLSLTKVNRLNFIDELVEYAKIYRKYLTPGVLEEDELTSEYGIERLNFIIYGLDTTTLIPYLLFVLRNQSDQLEIQKIARVLESYLMRRVVGKCQTKNYSDLFSKSLLDKNYLKAETLASYLQSKERDTALSMPTDRELSEAFNQNILLDIRARGVLYLLESKMRSKMHSSALKPFKYYALEHLMPKKWTPSTWPIFNSEDAEARNIKLRTLGNLALITQSLNSSISNNSWTVKLNGKEKKKGLKEYATGLVTMTDVLSQEQWNEEAIDTRADWLYDHARVIWNFKDVQYEASSSKSNKINESYLATVASDNYSCVEENSGQTSDKIFYINAVDCHVRCQSQADGQVIVLKGSTIRRELSPKFERIDYRRQIVSSHCEILSDKELLVKKDFPPMTPSGASSLCLGRSSNGRTEWKDSEGNKYENFFPKTSDEVNSSNALF